MLVISVEMFIEIINTKMISRLDAGPSERLVDTNSGYQPGEDLPSCLLVFCLTFLCWADTDRDKQIGSQHKLSFLFVW